MFGRIAIISEHASPLAALGGVDSGGQNVYVAQLANQLTARGHRVDVYTRRDNAALPEVLKCINGVRVVHVPAGPPQRVRKEELLPFMDEFARAMEAYCSRHGLRYDMLHANFWTSGIAAMRLKERLGLPFVITFHALGHVRRLYQRAADQFPDERPRIEAEIIAAADAVIAECPQDQLDLIQHYQADPAKITIIPCGFDTDEMWPVPKIEARQVLGLAQREPIVLQLGRMVPRKGIDTVIHALARLQRRHGIAARLVVVGGESVEPDPRLTPEIGRLQRIARQHGVAERVIFTGRRDRHLLRYYYSAADIFVTTPWYEPFGITPVEAMACGTPVVGAQVGGIQSTVRHGRTGFLVPPRDAKAVAARLAYLIERPHVRDAFGLAARQRAVAHYTWTQVAEQTEALYDRILRRGEHPVTRRRTKGNAGFWTT